VVLDSRMNETAELADYVIAASQPFERHDISMPGDGLYPEAFVQYAPPVVDKPGDVIDDWAFFWGVAAYMKLPLTLKYWTYGLNFDDIKDGLPLDMTAPPDPEEMIRFLCKRSRVPFDVIKANPSGVRPDIEPQFVQAAPEDNGARLALCPTDIAAELEVVLNEVVDNRFAYQLTSRRILEAMNSAYRDGSRSRKKYPVNWAYMNPEDMIKEGVVDGDNVEIESEAGKIQALVKGEDRLRSGVISMTHMFGRMRGKASPLQQGGSFTGRLTSLQQYLEPINFMPRFSGVPVNIRRQ
uniref:molybdopterin dinucleotide binding domain-containing protein n=1 Tax=Zhongshania sp. TaxID=1971902 RepID=UPI003562D4CE